jgi:uncharacterized glyoxalase superfamily protein PhnB
LLDEEFELSIGLGFTSKHWRRSMTAMLLAYEDLPRARDFLVSALGFAEEYSDVGSDGILVRSHVRLGETMLLLASPGAHDVRGPKELGGITHLIVVTVSDLDHLYERAVAGGAEVLSSPTDRPWGRDFEIRDPEGYAFNFIT